MCAARDASLYNARPLLRDQTYSLFELSRPRFGSGSSRRRSQHILCILAAFLRNAHLDCVIQN